LYSQWNTVIVREYTGKHLTFGSDRLPALSGLAKVFMRILKDKYVAGLWEGDMLRGLLWHGTGEFNVSATYRAPTWSWASIDGPVTAYKLGDAKLHPAAEVKEVVTVPLRSDVTGQLTGGHLRLGGTLLKIRLKNYPYVLTRTLRLKASLEVLPGNLNPDSKELIFYPLALGTHPDLLINSSIDDLRAAKEILFVPLLYHTNNDPNLFVALGIALCPQDGVDGCYKKIGSVRAHGVQLLKLLRQTCRVKIEEPRYYEDFDGNVDYTIKIF
jgi:hypothetical protein